jgi:hypothetical protein
MGLNIKNEETCALIRELSRLTGETMTHAVSVAVRERLEREHARRRRASAAENAGDRQAHQGAPQGAGAFARPRPALL